MRFLKEFVIVISALWLAITFGCGGGGGGSDSGSSGTGTISMSMTDAKPLLPENSGGEINNVFVTIDEVLVHKSGGGWVPLPLPKSPAPYRIDLLQFSEGNTTELVPPVDIDSGKYTQVRLSVVSASLTFKSNPNVEIPITIPSENLKTDKNFDFTVPVNDDGNEVDKAAVDITIDFVLSKSLVLEGSEYKLKPVLHIVETDNAATIEGTVANDSFVDPEIPGDPPTPPYVVVTVFDSAGQEYTKVQVDRKGPATDGTTTYPIYWLVPDQDYTVCIDYDPLTNPDTDPMMDCQNVPAGDVGPGEIATVNFP